jgi:hypothetical protein
MRWDGRFAGHLLHVHGPFEERSTGSLSLRRGRGLPCRFRKGREPGCDLTAASARMLQQLLPVRFWLYQLPRLPPRLTDP